MATDRDAVTSCGGHRHGTVFGRKGKPWEMKREDELIREGEVPMSDEQQVNQQQRFVLGMNKMSSTQPPIVYFILGLVCLAFWALGGVNQ